MMDIWVMQLLENGVTWVLTPTVLTSKTTMAQ